jgi:hypothetical protein
MQEMDDSGSHGAGLPFASAVGKRPSSSKSKEDTPSSTSTKHERKTSQSDRARNAPSTRQKSIDVQSLATTEAASSMTSSGDALAGPPSAAKSPLSPASNHRAELGRLGSPRHAGPGSRKEGSEGTPSMGSSFSDIDGEFRVCLS